MLAAYQHVVWREFPSSRSPFIDLSFVNKDNFESCHDLAIIFSEGKGTTIDNWRATNLYNVACDNNFSRSCHNLALLKVEELNFIEAEKLYKKSCLLNNYASCLNLGNMYYYGDLGVTNFDLANNYYAIACENNYADGCYNLAFSYFETKKRYTRENDYSTPSILSFKYTRVHGTRSMNLIIVS